MTDDNLIFYGGAVKALGDGKVGGYLVRYSGAEDPDLVKDFFDNHSDLGAASIKGALIPVYYQHGYDEVLKSKRLAFGESTPDDIGIWLQTQLDLRDEYEKGLYAMAEAGKLAYSSQAAGTLVVRTPVGKSSHVDVWPIAEASLTPTPAEWRNVVLPVKSLYTKPEQETEPETTEEVIMTDETKAKVEVQEKPEIDVEAIIEKAVKATAEQFKPQETPKPKGGVKVVDDEADRALKGNPFKTAGEFFGEVKKAAIMPYSIDKRLLPLKAEGLNEAIPSEGGFLIPPTFANGIRDNMWETGRVLSLFKPDPVEGNSMTINLVDETSRADGSRNGGIRGYWQSEAMDMTASQPTFKQVLLKLKKVTALVYATEEQLEDVSYMGSWLLNKVPEELRFKVEDAIIDGTGIGMPLGILQSGCLVSATRTDASEVDADDIGRMWSRRYLGSNDYVWLVNQSVLPQLYRMTVAAGGYQAAYMPPGGLSQAPYGTLMGRPVYETEYNPYLGTVGDILLASPSKYAMINKRGGIQSASSIHVEFLSWQQAFRFGYRVDGQPEWNSAVTAFDGTNTISPFVALAATT